MFDRTRAHDDIIRRMAEPEYLRELRNQAERIRAQKKREVEGYFHDLEADRFRREIRKAGETPCR